MVTFTTFNFIMSNNFYTLVNPFLAGLPVDIKPLFIASAFENNARGPNVDDVKSVLAKHGVECETHKMEVRSECFHDTVRYRYNRPYTDTLFGAYLEFSFSIHH